LRVPRHDCLSERSTVAADAASRPRRARPGDRQAASRRVTVRRQAIERRGPCADRAAGLDEPRPAIEQREQPEPIEQPIASTAGGQDRLDEPGTILDGLDRGPPRRAVASTASTSPSPARIASTIATLARQAEPPRSSGRSSRAAAIEPGLDRLDASIERPSPHRARTAAISALVPD
jgi:hypothetical protein